MASSPIALTGAAPRTPEEAEALLTAIAQAGHALGPAVWPESVLPGRRGGGRALAERRYRALVEQIPVVTFLAALDQETQELYVSPQIQELLGFSQKEWLEDPFLWYNQLHPDDSQRWANEFARTCATGTHFRSEYRFIARDGRVVWVHGECQVIRDEQGTPLFLQGIAYDITESKKAQELLQGVSQELEMRVRERTAELHKEIERRQELADQLAEEGRQKDQFLAVLAHELRNPLAPVLPALDMLRQKEMDPEERRWAIDMIGRQVGQMSRLIGDLLDISRISRGKISLQESIIDLRTVLSRALDVVRPLLENRRHKLVAPSFPDPVLVRGDPLRLEQIITNLLTNAARYTEPDGLIQVELRGDDGHSLLCVRDNGIGIPANMLEKIFEMFTQVNTSLARPTESGLGIGLSLVRGLVQLHGGSVTAGSAGPGRGSEFTVRLPRVNGANQPAPGAAVRHAGERSLPRRKILIVEDNRDAARALSRLFTVWNQDVAAVHDGAAALAAVAANPPEIIFMDIGLPVMDGYEVARRIRRSEAGGHIFLVAVSGYGQPEDRKRALDAGFDMHLTKPVEIDSIRHLLADDRMRISDVAINGRAAT